MAATMELIEFHLQFTAWSSFHGPGQQKNCLMRLAYLRVDTPGRVGVTVNSFGYAPIRLIKISHGSGNFQCFPG